MSVNVFSTKVLIGETVFTPPTRDGTAILVRGHTSYSKVWPFAGRREYLYFSVILRPWVLVRSRESNPRPNAIQYNALYLSVNVFSTKVLIGETVFTPPTRDGTAILVRGHTSYSKVWPFAGRREYLYFSVILRPWVLVRSRESNPRPPALQSNVLPTELVPALVSIIFPLFFFWLFSI